MISGLVLAPMLAVASASLSDGRGHPADWLAAVALAAAALAVCNPVFRSGARLGWPALSLAGLCCLASVTTVEVSTVKLVELGPLEVSARMLLLGMICLLMFVASLFHLGSGWRSGSLGVFALSFVATAVLLPANSILIYLLPQLLGLAAYWIGTVPVQEGIERDFARQPGPAASAQPAGPSRGTGGAAQGLRRQADRP